MSNLLLSKKLPMGANFSGGSCVNSVIFTYDGAGKRIQSVEDGIVTKYLYDGMSVVVERDATDTTIATYNRGISYGGGIGGIISKTDAFGQNSYYHYDGIGTVAGLTDSAGNLNHSYTYDAFGNQLSSEGATENNCQFQTKEVSGKSGLVYFGARYYDPRTGRWISKDPLTWGPDDPRMFLNKSDPIYELKKEYILYEGLLKPQNLNRYVYCNNDPVNWIDPWGLCGEKDGRSFWEWIKDFFTGTKNKIFYKVI